MNPKKLHWFIISTFVSLYVVVSVISTIHVIEFFKLSNPEWLAIFLAIAFEIGAAASLASIITLEKMNKNLIWLLFFVLTFMQSMGNTYYAFVNLENFESWSQLFGLDEEELVFQKRVLSLISGAILPLVALGFIKSLVDYLKPAEKIEDDQKFEQPETRTSKNILFTHDYSNQDELIIDGGGILVKSVDFEVNPENEHFNPDEIQNISSEENFNQEILNLEKSETNELELEKSETEKDGEKNSESNIDPPNQQILYTNSNRPKISDHPKTLWIDPTKL